MSFLKNIKISRAIMLVSFIPILVAIVIAAQLILGEMRHSSQLGKLATLTELSVKMSNLVHEQQKERGATAVFVGSKGAKFGPELARQRSQTNDKRAEFEEFVAGFDTSQFDSAFKTKFDALLATLGKMDTIRASVDALSISAPDAIGYYTGLNAQNLGLIEYMANLSPDAIIVTHFVAYANFLQGKERAGIERAVGANGFASGRFTPKAMAKFGSLINAQNIFNQSFLAYATNEQKQLFQQVMSSPAAQEVQKMRDVALSGGLQGELSGISGKQWFDT
ncbi:MAG: nitrate- and nitrite sensing domain-containing protein, partial [Alphaproteobacteria bacterium]|nr:nitrate- and nitrite sensing domain-containing protein [Alphaproteobacteria bacterium]